MIDVTFNKEILGLDDYPVDIDGDCTKDSLFKEFTDLKLFPEVQRLISEVGDEEEANFVLWSYILLLDPRRIIHERMMYEDKKKFISKNYYPVDWASTGYVKDFVLKNILINDDVILYIKLKENYDKNVITSSKSYKQKMDDKRQLDVLKKRVYAEMSENKKQRKAQGKKQPGGKTLFRN